MLTTVYLNSEYTYRHPESGEVKIPVSNNLIQLANNAIKNRRESIKNIQCFTSDDLLEIVFTEKLKQSILGDYYVNWLGLSQEEIENQDKLKMHLWDLKY